MRDSDEAQDRSGSVGRRASARVIGTNVTSERDDVGRGIDRRDLQQLVALIGANGSGVRHVDQNSPRHELGRIGGRKLKAGVRGVAVERGVGRVERSHGDGGSANVDPLITLLVDFRAGAHDLKQTGLREHVVPEDGVNCPALSSVGYVERRERGRGGESHLSPPVEVGYSTLTPPAISGAISLARAAGQCHASCIATITMEVLMLAYVGATLAPSAPSSGNFMPCPAAPSSRGRRGTQATPRRGRPSGSAPQSPCPCP